MAGRAVHCQHERVSPACPRTAARRAPPHPVAAVDPALSPHAGCLNKGIERVPVEGGAASPVQAPAAPALAAGGPQRGQAGDSCGTPPCRGCPSCTPPSLVDADEGRQRRRTPRLPPRRQRADGLRSLLDEPLCDALHGAGASGRHGAPLRSKPVPAPPRRGVRGHTSSRLPKAHCCGTIHAWRASLNGSWDQMEQRSVDTEGQARGGGRKIGCDASQLALVQPSLRSALLLLAAAANAGDEALPDVHTLQGRRGTQGVGQACTAYVRVWRVTSEQGTGSVEDPTNQPTTAEQQAAQAGRQAAQAGRWHSQRGRQYGSTAARQHGSRRLASSTTPCRLLTAISTQSAEKMKGNDFLQGRPGGVEGRHRWGRVYAERAADCTHGQRPALPTPRLCGCCCSAQLLCCPSAPTGHTAPPALTRRRAAPR